MTVDEARLATHANSYTRRDFVAEFAAWCQRRKAEQQERRAARRAMPPRRDTFILDGFVWSRLPLVSVTLIGARRNFKHFYPMTDGMYDLADDVRELVCERIRFDVYAEWSDPREWLTR